MKYDQSDALESLRYLRVRWYKTSMKVHCCTQKRKLFNLNPWLLAPKGQQHTATSRWNQYGIMWLRILFKCIKCSLLIRFTTSHWSSYLVVFMRLSVSYCRPEVWNFAYFVGESRNWTHAQYGSNLMIMGSGLIYIFMKINPNIVAG